MGCRQAAQDSKLPENRSSRKQVIVFDHVLTLDPAWSGCAEQLCIEQDIALGKRTDRRNEFRKYDRSGVCSPLHWGLLRRQINYLDAFLNSAAPRSSDIHFSVPSLIEELRATLRQLLSKAPKFQFSVDLRFQSQNNYLFGSHERATFRKRFPTPSKAKVVSWCPKSQISACIRSCSAS